MEMASFASRGQNGQAGTKLVNYFNTVLIFKDYLLSITQISIFQDNTLFLLHLAQQYTMSINYKMPEPK
jgi:hypothetical protein